MRLKLIKSFSEPKTFPLDSMIQWAAWAVALTALLWLLDTSYRLIDSSSSVGVGIGFGLLGGIVFLVGFLIVKGGMVLWRKFRGYFDISSD